MQRSDSEKKVLLRISNLKQYFPLKKKGLFVKANDGITLDIYEGETFGLVGESGCGKSTLGRSLLMLYRQTDGRTMYYGRTLEEMAPRYVRRTLENIPKLRGAWLHLKAQREALQRDADALQDGEAKYERLARLDKAKKEEEDALLHMAKLIGGFVAVEDIAAPLRAFKEEYDLCRARAALRRRCDGVRVDLEDALFRQEKAERADKSAKPDRSQKAEKPDDSSMPDKSEKRARPKKPGAYAARIDKLRAQIERLDARIAQTTSRIQEVRAALDAMRAQHRSEPAFEQYEALRDTGIDLARLESDEIRLLRRDLQLIFQDPYSSLNPRMTVGNIIGEGLLAHGFFRRNDERMQAYIIKTMEEAGLASYFLHRYAHQFSGGQRQRIGIARSLAVQPRFVVCDEAVSALDVSIQSQIINLLYDLKQRAGLTYLFITHDLSVVKYISDRIGVMYLGSMVELAPTRLLFDRPLHPYTEALMAAIPTTDMDAKGELRILEGDMPSPVHPPQGCKFHTRCSRCTEVCRRVMPAWREVDAEHFVACHHPLNMEECAHENPV